MRSLFGILSYNSYGKKNARKAVQMKIRVYHLPTRMLWALALVACLAAMLALVGCFGGASKSSNVNYAPSSTSSAVSEQSSSSTSSSASGSTSGSASSSASTSVSSSSAAGDPALKALLTESMQEVANAAGMEVGATTIDLKTNTHADVDGDKVFTSASLIKLIVAEAFLQEVEAGTYNLDDMYVLQDADIVGGSGSLAGLGAGAEVSYHDLVYRMICDSDNTAANALISELGMDAINSEAKRLNLNATKVNRLMMDTDAIASGIENYTSANDVATLLQMVYERTFVSPEASEFMLEALEDQYDQQGILEGLPADVVFAHKTGWLDNARHDGGIVLGTNPFVIVVMCGGEGYTADGAIVTMAQMGAAVNSVLAE